MVEEKTSNEKNMVDPSRRLDDISLMRIVLTLLLVLYHSFIIYDGGWEMPDGACFVGGYRWISRISYGFLMEAFVFMSGFLWNFRRGKEPKPFGKVVRSKSKRLLLPSLVFGALYILMNGVWEGSLRSDLVGSLPQLIFGVGHLWFLVMLFLCFVLMEAVDRLDLNHRTLLFCFLLVSLFSSVPLPYRMNRVLLYFFFFYLGSFFKEMLDMVKIDKKGLLILFWIGYFILFFSMKWLIENRIGTLDCESSFVRECLVSVSIRMCVMLYSTLGLFVFWQTAKYIVCHCSVSRSFLSLDGYSFGVYIVHQFVIIVLLYHTPIPSMMGSVLLPWFVFVAALSLSMLIVFFLRKFSWGRFLLG